MDIIEDTLTSSRRYFDIYFESKSSFITLSASSIIMISMLSLAECVICSLSLSMEEIKLLAIVN